VPITVVSSCSKDAPQKAHRNLLNDLVGAGEEHGRHVEAERHRRLEVHDSFVVGRHLHWLCLTWRRAVGQPTALGVPRQKDLEEFTGDVPIRDRVLRLVAGEHR
jgi:hypothetical protein